MTAAGKVAIVTGASRGIGEATAALLLASGAKGVAITSRREENLAEAVERIGTSERLISFAARADSEEAADATVQAVIRRFGSCDILINNAGTNPSAGDLASVDLGAVGKTWEVNQLGPLLWSRAAWRHYMSDHGGAIVNIASVGGMAPSPIIGAYNISKAAVIHLTRQLAMEFAPSVRVNSIAPSVVRTKLAAALWEGIEEQVAASHPLQRIGEPSDIAAAVMFLVSDEASWITGINLPVDGGVTGATSVSSIGG
ncbi:MAG: SDR family oxidoreductase [bacterium]|nr:SDR family oxidoreductase [bacterium]